MSLTLILAGIAIGLAMSAPLGPVNIIVIRAALGRGFWPAFVCGRGAVIADVLFAAVAAYGVRSVEQVISLPDDYERLLAGEIVSGELKVSQITSEGVVLQLGDQVFLLPRGGR